MAEQVDRLYEDFPTTAKNPAYLQTLKAESLKPGSTYIIWFKQNEPSKAPATLTAAINFLPGTKDEWDHEEIEKGLALKPAAPAKQAEYFNSRGARILLDGRFFKPNYAKTRIEDLRFSLRNSKEFSNGLFMEMRIQIPPCGTDPLLKEIISAHGEPDLILSAEEVRLFEKDGAQAGPACYYDRFGFVMDAWRPDRVFGVQSQASDASRMRPTLDGLTWNDVPLRTVDLRIFYRDKKEIARVAFWGKENARVTSGTFPAGAYRRSYDNGANMEELVNVDREKWTYRAFTQAGKEVRNVELVNHSFHGTLRESYPDGKPRAEVPYNAGRVEGLVIQWSRDGELKEKMFENGEPGNEVEATDSQRVPSVSSKLSRHPARESYARIFSTTVPCTSVSR